MQSGFFVSQVDGEPSFEVLGEEHCRIAGLIQFATDSRASAILMGRLYYQRDLAHAAGIGSAERDRMSEVELALAAYKSMGRRSFELLEGDYSLVVYDHEKQVIFATRDPLGGFPLFHARNGNRVAVSTSLRALAQWSPQSEISVEFLSEYLMLPTSCDQEVPAELTAYRGIARVLPGRTIEIPTNGGPTQSHVVWNWEEQINIAANGPSDLESLGAEYYALVKQSVRERMRGRVASHFSGGMDSTSIGLIAYRELLSSDKPLQTYTVEYNGLPGQRLERPYIDAAREAAPDAIHHTLSGEDWLDFDVIDSQVYQDEPSALIWASTMSTKKLERAGQDGVDTVFSGFGGDEFVDILPCYISDIVKRGQLLKAAREAKRWAIANNGNRWYYLWKHGISRLFPTGLSMHLATGMRGGFTPWNRQTHYSLPPWFSPQFAKQNRLFEKSIRAQDEMKNCAATQTMSMLLTALRRRPGDTLRWTHGVEHGVFPAHPFLDRRVIRFCLQMHDRLPINTEVQKPMLGEAMKHLLPEKIRLRKDKGHFTEVAMRGFARNLPKMEKIVREAPVENVGFLNKDVLMTCLRQTAAGVCRATTGTQRLYLSLFLLKWLTMESQRRNEKFSRRRLNN